VREHYPPGPLALGRYAVASLTLLPVWWWRGRRRPRPAELPGLALTGVLGFTVYNLCVNAAEQSVPAGTAALVVTCIPVLTTLGAVLCFGERLNVVGWLGVVVACAGAGLIHRGAPQGPAAGHGVLLLGVAALSATGYNLLSKRYLARYAALDVTTWAIWAGTLGALPFGRALPAAVAAAPPRATLTVVALGVVPAALCYTLWAWLTARRPLARLANLLFLVPVNAVLLGAALLDEAPSGWALLGGLVVVGGVTLVGRSGRRV